MFVILGHFSPLQPPDNLENQNFKIEGKKTWRYYHFTHLHQKWQSYNDIMYDSWDMEHERHNFLSFWTVFYPFTPLWTQKIRILKKWKKMPQDITILQICTINFSHMMYGYWEIECNKQNFLSFWTIFCSFTP